jgi:hypothetical protein
VARLAAWVGARGLADRRPQCALLHASFLPVACQRVEPAQASDLFGSLFENQDLKPFNLFCNMVSHRAKKCCESYESDFGAAAVFSCSG